ncbi:MAG: efflux RND transporter periplasmic adaptor subunit [Cyclobacteriaceae bacterium]|nr:efflux RND transporter periplasmic adaptor subunit [Cyclobacteriaceae bacterium]
MKNIHLLYIAVAAITLSCSGSTQENASQNESSATDEAVHLTDEQVKNLDIQLGKIEVREISSPIRVNGMLDVPPQNLVTIAAPLGGFVKHTELLQGMRVKKGQVVAVLEHPDYIQLQQDYLESKTQLEFLELEYKRQQELSAENVNAAKVLQQSKSNYFSAKAKEEGLRARLKLVNLLPEKIEQEGIKSTINILTPIAGYVTEVNVNRGAYVNSADTMFEIVDTEHLHAEAQVFEKDVMQLKVGQPVRLRLANEAKERLASVYLIGKELSADRTVRVHCHLEEEDHELIPGQYFSAVIETEGNPVKAVPQDAVVRFEGVSYLFYSKSNGSFGWAEVNTGEEQDGYIEVKLPEGFDEKLPVVIKGSYILLSKLKNVEDH